MFKSLDHIAIIVPDTAEALRVWRDRFGFPVLLSEVVNNGTVRLTHLDLGNTHLQLVEPLAAGHPLARWLAAHGSGIHHFCLAVEDVGAAQSELAALGLASNQPQPHQGTGGKRALFLDPATTAGVPVELTGR